MWPETEGRLSGRIGAIGPGTGHRYVTTPLVVVRGHQI
jgi:hypothetical protein